MSLETIFASYFKPEIQKRGREDFAKGLAFVTNSSDTQIQGFVKSMPPLKVTFHSDSIASPLFIAICTCSAAARGTFCKHMWSMLLAVEKKHPDFLDSKKAIEIGEGREQKKLDPRAEAYKQKQYEKQKAWAKEKRNENKRQKAVKLNPEREKYNVRIEQALVFFTQNGFIMNDLPDIEELKKAKKHLARVFHPDKGGSHEEAVNLNKHFDVLSRFLAMSSE